MKRITKLGLSFDKEAALYHMIRPSYPDALFNTLIDATALASDAQILEIGPGTGQATKSFAQRGYQVVAVEIGKSLAEIARRELQQYSNAKIITGVFEEIELPHQSFDLVFSAISLHWIKPGWKYRKPHQLLKPQGHIAIVHTHPITDAQGDFFFHASQPIYQKYFPKSNNLKTTLPKQEDIEAYKLDENLFHLSHFSTFTQNEDYTAREYRQLVNTFSPTLRLPREKRESFLNDIEHLIETEFNNKLQRNIAISLTVAKKLSR